MFITLLICFCCLLLFFFSSRRRHTRFSRDWSSDVCSSDLYIIKHLFNYYGPDATNNFVTGIQRLTNRFLMLYGSSCGISDIYVPQEVKNTLMKRINEAQKGIYEIVEKFGHGKVTIPLTKNTIDFYEELIKSTIGKSLKENNDTLQQYLNSIEWNNLSNMIMSGSKGDILNLMQIADTVGQQSILGKR